MPREGAAAKAIRILAEGRLVVVQVQPGEVRSTCRGEGAIWMQAYSHGMWSCTCSVRTDACSHLRALRRVVAVDVERTR